MVELLIVLVFIGILASIAISSAFYAFDASRLGKTMGNLRGPSVHAFDNFIHGAPPMAPLLFPNLMVLGIIALWQLRLTYSR